VCDPAYVSLYVIASTRRSIYLTDSETIEVIPPVDGIALPGAGNVMINFNLQDSYHSAHFNVIQLKVRLKFDM